MNPSVWDRLQGKLEAKKKKNEYRELQIQGHLKDFASNDYLGLSTNTELAELVKAEYNNLYKKEGYTGSTGSRLICGHHKFIQDLETFLASYFGTETTLLFNSGYSANSGLFQSVVERNDIVIYDEKSHASIKEGIRLSFGKAFSFKHNDVEDLKKKLLKDTTGHKFVVVESVYSMDGDKALLEEISRLCKAYKAYLIVDEAHSTGCYNTDGSGLCSELNINEDIFCKIMTFGKAVGAHGACICGNEILKNSLINFSRPFIYTTALPLHSLVSIKVHIDYIINHNELIKQLFNNITALAPEHTTPIYYWLLGSTNEAKRLSQGFKEKGYFIKPILSPTVKVGEEGLRISLHANQFKEDIITIKNILNQS